MITVSAVETDAPRGVQYADDEAESCGRILGFEESVAAGRWFYGPDAPPDPQFDPMRPSREQILRWARWHGLTLYQGRPGAKHPRKHHCDPGCKWACSPPCARKHRHHWCAGCPERVKREDKCRCFIMWSGKGPALIRVPQHMAVLDEDGPAAAVLTASMNLPPHFAIRSRTTGGIKRFGFIAGGVRRAVRIRDDFDLIGNPDSKCVWVKIWDDAGYDIISQSDAVPEWPEPVTSLAAPAGGRRRGKKRGRQPSASTAGGDELPPTGMLVAGGIPYGRQEDWLFRVADRLAREQWLQRREFDEDQITGTLIAIARASEQDDSDPWTSAQLRDKARSAIEFITRETQMETAEAGARSDGDAVTDSHLAGRFAAEVLRGRYCWVTGSGWLAWRGDRWSRLGKDDRSVVELAREWVLAQYQAFLDEAGPGKDIASGSKAWLQQLSKQHVRAVAELAEGIVQHDASEFDAHPDLLNCANGVADLRTGELLPHDPALMLTRTTGVRYVPGAAHPDWDKALTALPEDVRDWYQIRIGQGATGYMPPDDVVLINKGGGENGKTTVLQGISHALGDYYVQVPPQALYGDTSQHATVMMTFRGARIAALEETPEEGRLNMQQVKQMTTPQISARYLYRDFTTFDTTHSAIVNTNHELLVESTDHGSWRRLPLVRWPYTYLKPGQRKKLADPPRRRSGAAGQDHRRAAGPARGRPRLDGRGRPPVVRGRPGDAPAARHECRPTRRRGAPGRTWSGGSARNTWSRTPSQHVIADELYEFFNSVLRDSGHRAWSKDAVLQPPRGRTPPPWGGTSRRSRPGAARTACRGRLPPGSPRRTATRPGTASGSGASRPGRTSRIARACPGRPVDHSPWTENHKFHKFQARIESP